MRDRLSRWAQAFSNWSLAALLFTLPSGKHWGLYAPPPDDAHYAYYEPVLYATELFLCAALASWLLGRLLSRDRSKL